MLALDKLMVYTEVTKCGKNQIESAAREGCNHWMQPAGKDVYNAAQLGPCFQHVYFHLHKLIFRQLAVSELMRWLLWHFGKKT